MLKIFRKKIVSKIVLWGLLILIVPAFVMWGGANLSRSKDKGASYVGWIDEKKILFDQLYLAMSGVRAQTILNYFNQPQVLEAILGNRPLLAKLGWDRLILLAEARRLKLRASDKEVISYIQTHPLFLKKDVFDEKFYIYILHNSMGLEPRDFEEIVRENITIKKLGDALTKDVKISDADVEDSYKKEFGRIKIAYLIIDTAAAAQNVKLDENTVKDFYDKHKTELMIKSKLKGALPDRQATFEEAKETIENTLKTNEAKKVVSKEAEDIYAKAAELRKEKGATFYTVSSKLGFKAKDSQFISATDTLEDIGEGARIISAAFTMNDLEVSKPLEVKNGFVIFQVTDREAVDAEKFKKEKEEYSKKVRERRSNAAMEEWLRKGEEKAKLNIELDEIEKYYR